MNKTNIKLIKNMLLAVHNQHFEYEEYRKDLGVVLDNEELGYVNDTFSYMSECLSIVNYIKKTTKGVKNRAVFIGKLEDELIKVPTNIYTFKEKRDFLEKLEKLLNLDVVLRDRNLKI